MRAFFLENIDPSTSLVIIDDYQHHHYVHVLRGKVDEPVLVLNGKGLKLCGKVINISKKNLEIEIVSSELIERVVDTEIAIGIPKRDYLIDILRMSTEIGVSVIHLISVDRTPWKFKYNERFDKVIMAALLQSNNLYLPEIITYSNLSDFLGNLGSKKVLTFSTEQNEKSCENVNLALVGPEGGFSDNEVEMLTSSKNIFLTRLPNPIMKSVTAVPFALGKIQ
jgi:16S rRNA (uracil1498-N3)-methyltransferase